MSLVVADLVGVMDMDDSGFHEKLDRGHSKFLSVAGAIGRAAMGIGAAGAAGLVAAGGLGLKTAANLEQAEIGFTTMLGSATAAKSFLADLSRFAASTPFEMPQLQSAASRLISVGVNANRVIPIMRVLGDSTAAMGTGADGIERATAALQQMQVKGKVSGEEMLQLAEAGIPAWDALAAHLGVTTAKAQDMVTKGKVSVEDLYAAIETGAGSSLQRVSGMMNVQAQSMTGLWSTLKDTVSMGLAAAIQPLVPMIKQGLGSAIAFAAAHTDELAAALQGAVVWVRNLVSAVQAGGATQGFAGNLTKVIDVVRQLRSGDTAELSGQFGNLRDKLGEVGPAAQNLLEKLPSLSDTINVAATVVGFLADHADLLADALPYVVAGFVLYKAAQAAANVVSIASIPLQAAQTVAQFRLAAALRATAASSTSSAASQVAASGAVSASSLRASTATLMAQTRIVAGWVAAGAAAVVQGAVMVASTALTAARVVAGWVLMGVQSMIQAARMAAAWFIALGPIGWITAAVIAIVALVVANWDWVSSRTAAIWSVISSLPPAAGRAILDFFLRWTLVGIVISHWSEIQTAATRIWGAITSFVAGIPGRIVSFFLNWTLVGVIISHWDQIRTGVATKAGDLVSFVAGIPGRIVSAIGDLGSRLYGAGQAVIQGLIDGITSMVARLGSAMRDAVSRGISAFLPGSPVKAGPLRVLNNGRAGAMIVQMLADGLDREWRTLQQRMQLGTLVPLQLAGATGAGGGSGVHIDQLLVQPASGRFALSDVMDDLRWRGVR